MVFIRNVNEGCQMELASVLRVIVLPKHEKYLGPPTVAGCSKRELFEGIKDRIWCKLHTWSAKKLSQAGHAILLKTVLHTIPTYAMSYFCLSDSFLNDIKSTMVDFFGHGGEETKIHWKVWAKLCKLKTKAGLDFRRLRECNIALLAKQACRIAMNPGNVLHEVISHKYFPESTFVKARLGVCPSCMWQSI
ncbi:UNVERIFIED_CONTAM: hypothetical protein Sradi_0190400 [Sesamum radiatum]|uniref:Reverse transcriptase n=1 Tax=Sesamum radiatum TaxID=300843 RepID=A0AAW2W121_SESRA